MKDQIKRDFEEHSRVQKEFLKDNTDMIVRIVEAIIGSVRNGRKVLFFGNGGSAADAQHLAAEFVNRFRVERKALPAVALTCDTSVLTSIANDRGYEKVFSRQVEALGTAGDVAVGITTSNTSPNVVEAIRTARAEGLITVAFGAGDGGPLFLNADYCLRVPSKTTARIQEMHLLAGHVICELVDQAFAERTRKSP